MKRFLLLAISSCAMLIASAQEEIVLDSIPKIKNELEVRQLSMEKPLVFDDSFSIDGISLFDHSMFNQPLLPDYTKSLDMKKYLSSSRLTTESYSITGFGLSPFFINGNVYNQASYKLNNRFSFGGNSFGVQSIFDKPRMNSSIQEMSIKGASMFMQYKVSKNFKVETRVSVTNHQSPWEP